MTGRYEKIRKVLAECRDIAMEWTLRGRIPECGKFGEIAQDLDAVCSELETTDSERAQQPAAAQPQPKRRRYDPSGSLSEYGISPECDAQPPADDEVVFIDGVGAARSSVKSCRYGVQWIKVGDRVYWPLSDSDAKRLHSACCGKGAFDGPATPDPAEADAQLDALDRELAEASEALWAERAELKSAAEQQEDVLEANGEVDMTTDKPTEGEEVIVKTPNDVMFILPLQPSGRSIGPRFVVHVPLIEAPAVKALQAEIEALRAEVAELRAARIAYASEFPATKDGDPDTGNIHENIRALKVRAERLEKILGAYQSAVNKIDDLIEYSLPMPSETKAALYAVLAILTTTLAKEITND